MLIKQELRFREEVGLAEATASYNSPETHLDSQVLAGILEWLKKAK